MMGRLTAITVFFSTFTLVGEPSWTQSHLENAGEWGRLYAMEPLIEAARPGVGKRKIAVLGHAFDGLSDPASSNGPAQPAYLPLSAQFFSHESSNPVKRSFADRDRKLAQVIWGLTGFNENGPQLLLLNAQGAVNFRTSVLKAMEWKAEIILCTEHFDHLGNFDGTGPLNNLVDQAIYSGIIWIQSAGEFNGATYNGNTSFVNLAGAQYVSFSGNTHRLPLIVEADETDITLTLSWNGYPKGYLFEGTTQDLDLQVYRAQGDTPVLIAQSAGRQTDGDTQQEHTTQLATETVTLSRLTRAHSPYAVTITHSGGDFGPDSRFRLSLTSNKAPYYDEATRQWVRPVRFAATGLSGSIQIPADNPQAITIGVKSPLSSNGPTGAGITKPDIVFDDWTALFSDKRALQGPDVAAAHFTAWVALKLAVDPGFNTQALTELMSAQRRAQPPSSTGQWSASQSP